MLSIIHRLELVCSKDNTLRAGSKVKLGVTNAVAPRVEGH